MATKKSALTRDRIVSMYMDYSLEYGEKPKSVYKFTKLNDVSETEFYNFFGTIESVEKEIFKTFYDKTIELLQKNSDYETYDMKSKLLGFNFTFFELLTANRSYVVMTLKDDGIQLKNLSHLKGLKINYKKFVSEIITEDFRTKQEVFQNFQEKAFQESSWFQLLLAMKFWIDDSSQAFEKTDIYIEKSIKATFELMNITPIDSLIDFGKFIFKEKIYTK